jgi:hypothetical protein
MQRYTVKRHNGHSGRSVYEWRVYAITEHGGRTITTQLGKFHTEDTAIAFRNKLIDNANRVAARMASKG